MPQLKYAPHLHQMIAYFLVFIDVHDKNDVIHRPIELMVIKPKTPGNITTSQHLWSVKRKHHFS
jgi:hypothetical protein